MALRLTNAATLLLLAAVLALQWHAASFSLGTSLVGDDARHYTSGVMVFDYLRSGLGSNPVRFAEDFEVRYPLVAIGHWPPMYYAVQAVFYFLAGPYIRSAQVLSALMAACLAVLVLWSVRRRAGIWIALIAAAAFLAMPLMQAVAWEVMSDLLTALFVYCAILAFARLLDEPGNWKAAVGFAVFAVAAILTKGSAWALGPFFLLAPLLSRRSRFFRSRWFFGALFVVILLGSSFYLISERSGIGYPTRLSHYLTVGAGHRLSTLMQVLGFAPVFFLGLSALGLVDAVHARWWRGDESPWTTLSLTAAAWIASQLLFLLVLPMTAEPRVLLPSLAPAAVLVARLLQWVQFALRRRPVLAAAAPVMLGAMIVANAGAGPPQRFDGYRQAADAMPYPPDGALILVAANYGGGEGAVVSERLSHDRAHRDVILRGSHVLTEIDSAGKDRPLFQSAEAMRSYLLQMPVGFIVLSSPPFDFSYQALIDSAVTGDPRDFHLIANVPITKRPGGQIDQLRVYENVAAGGRHPAIVQTPMGYEGGRRMLEYHWK